MPRKAVPEPAPTDPTAVPNGFSDVARQRREQVIEAAIEIIATEGIHRLSLGNIEERVKMARGHLTYYFPTKEDILLAVFDRMLERLIAEAQAGDGPKPGTGRAWECARHMLAKTLEPAGPDKHAFLSLVHTFLAQIAYRDDFRGKIATAEAEWRGQLAADYALGVPRPPVPPAVAASILMALVQGLGGQLAVNPRAFDRDQMLAALRTILGPLFGHAPPPEGDRP
jgi:AcrR family transcriptional regulator